MPATAALFGVLLAAQVPAPLTPSQAVRPLRQEHRAILDREVQALRDLATRLDRDRRPEGAAEARRQILPPPKDDGLRHFRLLPELDVPPIVLGEQTRPSQQVEAARRAVDRIKSDSADALLALATRAALEQPRSLAIADACLRDALARRPDHPEVRRLLGYVPHADGWATPYAVRQFELGNVLHPVYGWVKRDWVPQLENGRLPGRVAEGEPLNWLPAARADALRRRYSSGWRIDSEHFHIQTNVPLSKTIAFGRGLEELHELFQSHFADVIGDAHPLLRRFRPRVAVDPAVAAYRNDPPPPPPDPRHDVSYFATRKEFIDYLRPIEGPGIAKSLGIYFPPGVYPRSAQGHAFFFSDTKGDLPVTATLHHEVSHQLLWESRIAGPNDYLGNDGNYWVFEGLGTYFETLTPGDDGTLTIGGLVGARNIEAKSALTEPGRLVPLPRFVRMDKRAFNHQVDIYRHYQQASALTSYLMHGEGEAYRESFLEYVRDATQGRVREGSGTTLEDRLGLPLQRLEEGFVRYLKGS